MAEEAKKVAAAKSVPKTYYVENVVRKVGSRLHRAKSATRHRFKLYVAGRRILRNEKLSLSEKDFEANKAAIRQMVLAGQVALYLPDGMKVTSLPDGRLVYRRPDGAVKIDDAPQPKQAPPAKVKVPEVTPEPPRRDEVKVSAPPPEDEVVEDEVAEEEDDGKKSKSYSSKKSSRKKE